MTFGGTCFGSATFGGGIAFASDAESESPVMILEMRQGVCETVATIEQEEE